MKLDFPALNAAGGLLATLATRAWMSRLDCKIAYYDRSVDPVFPECRGQKIYLFWHEYILFPFYLRGNCNLAMLLSRHRDAEVLSHAARHMGFETVRGSTNRGGVAAIRQLLKRSRRMHLTLTPDGPRGPRRRMAPGPIYLAGKLGLPMVLLGLGYDRPWRVNSWDRFAIPRPYSRARFICGPEIHVPPDLDRKGLDHFRGQTERLLNRLTREAEAWAESGTRRVGEHIGRPIQRPLRRVDSAHAAPKAHVGKSSQRASRLNHA